MKSIKTRTDLLNFLPKKLIIAELGVFEGTFSKEIFSICDPSKLFLVDLFDGVHRSGDKDGINFKTIDLGQSFISLQSFFSGKEVEIIKSNTEAFLSSLEDEYLDAVYIDADHSYNAVLRDLNMSLKKVKKHGFICGHDYVKNTEAEQAVNDFCSTNYLNINIVTEDGCPSFCIIKN
jgi:hypothetical protein